MDRLGRLTKAVEGLQEHNRALQEQLRALEAPTGEKAEYVAEMEQVHADLERRNKYLMGELERRDSETEKVKRPWWKWW